MTSSRQATSAPRVLNLLALLVQILMQFATSLQQATSAPQTNSAALLRGVGVTGFDRRHLEELGPQFNCLNGTKVQILTQKALL